MQGCPLMARMMGSSGTTGTSARGIAVSPIVGLLEL